MKATWNGETIAESAETIVVEGNHYFPRASVHKKYLADSSLSTHCSWKGDASYFTLEVNGAENPDAAWYYPNPKPEADHIRDYVAFWRGVEVSE